MNSNTIPHSMYGIMGACVVGIVGAAGMFIYEKVLAEKKRQTLYKQMASLDKRLESLQTELDALRKLQKESLQNEANKVKLRKKRAKPLEASQTDSLPIYTSDTDMYNSALSTDMDNSSDEFYDLSTDTDDESTSVIQAIDLVDKTLKSSTHNESDLKSVLCKLNESTKQERENAELYWRLAKVCHKLSVIATGQEREDWISKGLTNAEKALELNETNAECHKWYAILMGSRVEFLGIKDKIEEGFIFKRHVERALELNPTDPYLYYLLGRFKYEVSGLTWIERKLASSLFAEPPVATYAEAIDDFEKAEELSKEPWKDNRVLLAKSYVAISDYVNAAKWLNLAKDTPTEDNAQNKIVDEELEQLILKYGSYESS